MNKSAWFILPMLYNQTNNISNIINLLSNIKGCYIAEEGKPIDNKIIIHSDRAPIGFYNYIETIDDLHYFNIPNEYELDYRLFIHSKYSRFSGLLKLNICKMWNQDSTKLLFNVLFKTENLRKTLSSKNLLHNATRIKNGEFLPDLILRNETFINNKLTNHGKHNVFK
jgi:hypothetical protein